VDLFLKGYLKRSKLLRHLHVNVQKPVVDGSDVDSNFEFVGVRASLPKPRHASHHVFLLPLFLYDRPNN